MSMDANSSKSIESIGYKKKIDIFFSFPFTLQRIPLPIFQTSFQITRNFQKCSAFLATL